MDKQNNQEIEQIFGKATYYRDKIIKMINQIDNEKFLKQIHTILKKHIEKRGG